MTEVNYYETAKQEDVDWGVGTTTKRNPGGGTLAATQIGIHSMGVGQGAVSVTYDPPSLISLGIITTTVTVSGAALGDFVNVSFSLPLSGLLMFAEVTASNTITVTFFNPTTLPIDVSSGTLKVLVLKSR